MKYFLPFIFLLLSGFCYSQKYVLIDKKMSQPLAYTNTVTIANTYKNIFAVEKNKIHQFIAELERISAMLTNKKYKPETFNTEIGKTRFIGLKIPLATEDRLDVVLITDCDGTQVNMHLSDAKISNASNAYFINTWVKYIKGYLK